MLYDIVNYLSNNNSYHNDLSDFDSSLTDFMVWLLKMIKQVRMRMRAGNRGQFSLMPQALDTTSCSFVYKCYSSIGIGCFTQLHRNIYEAFRSSAASYLEIILLIHFPQVLTNSSTSALNLSITD